MMKRLGHFVLAAAIAFGAADAAAQCVATQNAKCESGGVGPTCWMESGSWCYRDATGCKTKCGTGGWDDCDEGAPGGCIEYQW